MAAPQPIGTTTGPRSYEDLFIHELDGGRFIGTACAAITRDPARGWERAESGLSKTFCYNLVFFPGDPTLMLLATGDGSPAFWERSGVARSTLYRSKDRADSWEVVGGGMPESLEAMPWALAAHPTDPQSAFAGFGQVSRGRAEVDASQEWEETAGQVGAVWATFDRGRYWKKLPIATPAVRSIWASEASR